jgi:hypothetical protein
MLRQWAAAENSCTVFTPISCSARAMMAWVMETAPLTVVV